MPQFSTVKLDEGSMHTLEDVRKHFGLMNKAEVLRLCIATTVRQYQIDQQGEIVNRPRPDSDPLLVTTYQLQILRYFFISFSETRLVESQNTEFTDTDIGYGGEYDAIGTQWFRRRTRTPAC